MSEKHRHFSILDPTLSSAEGVETFVVRQLYDVVGVGFPDGVPVGVPVGFPEWV
jgi:hypothetical protein